MKSTVDLLNFFDRMTHEVAVITIGAVDKVMSQFICVNFQINRYFVARPKSVNSTYSNRIRRLWQTIFVTQLESATTTAWLTTLDANDRGNQLLRNDQNIAELLQITWSIEFAILWCIDIHGFLFVPHLLKWTGIDDAAMVWGNSLRFSFLPNISQNWGAMVSLLPLSNPKSLVKSFINQKTTQFVVSWELSMYLHFCPIPSSANFSSESFPSLLFDVKYCSSMELWLIWSISRCLVGPLTRWRGFSGKFQILFVALELGRLDWAIPYHMSWFDYFHIRKLICPLSPTYLAVCLPRFRWLQKAAPFPVLVKWRTFNLNISITRESYNLLLQYLDYKNQLNFKTLLIDSINLLILKKINLERSSLI